ncbi:hypothetical protein FJQ54_16250 [Sandaracinobacter neustonicus]|uniref:DUF5333 domain-containing protein n=1 Tax=Sandaracinobacter neustonicus TaxID=1715348 RepID=A0A501XDD7_9SPHN|nr:hypothetical protein [Sandaracinobacter neustonicus]TPE58605.1 hypothetical protein FJQ54_16250 [Sandaracinobacter neustonicus]
MRAWANLLASLALAGVVAAPVSAACWEADEYEAARMRDLQTVLMVSALKCGHSDATMPGAYNSWVRRAKDKLLAGEQKLLAHFVREGDKAKYDKFTTALANRYSQYAEDVKFCARAKLLLEADEKSNGVLEEVALLLNSRPNGVEEMCPPKRPAGSQIIISPFDPIPDPNKPPENSIAAAPEAAPSAPAPAEAPKPEATPDATVSAPPQ